MINMHPDEFVAQLSENASTRKKRTLELLHNICKEQHKRGSKDFSLPTIARLLAEHRGPSEQAIRNKGGSDYRILLVCWAEHTNGSAKKTKTPKSPTTADEIIQNISNPTIRALVGITLAENRKLKKELSLLKHQTILTIDMRKPDVTALNGASGTVLVSPAYDLKPTEIASLRYAISDEFIKQQGWYIEGNGRVKMKTHTIYKPGYVVAIKKVLERVSEDAQDVPR